MSVNKGDSIIDMYPMPFSLEPTTQGGGGGGGGGGHVLFYKAESNLCGPPFAAPLEWHTGTRLHTNSSCSLVIRQARPASQTFPLIVLDPLRTFFASSSVQARATHYRCAPRLSPPPPAAPP